MWWSSWKLPHHLFSFPPPLSTSKSPLPRCCAHGKYPLRVKPGKLTPPSPPLFAPPLIEMWAFVASATSSPLMVGYRQQAYRQQVYQRQVYQWWAYQQRAYQQQAYQRRVYQRQVYRWWAINGGCINGRLLTAGVSMAGYWRQVYQWWAYKWWAINSGLSMVDVSRIDGGRIDGGCIQWAYLTHEAVFHPTCCLLYQEGPEPQWGNLFCIVIRLFS